MVHLTLNTGHLHKGPDGQVRPETVQALQPVIRGGNLGRVSPQFGAFRIEVTREEGCAAFTVYRGMEPIVLNVVCWKRDLSRTAWAGIEQTYLNLSDTRPQLMGAGASPEMPTTVPWLATCILPGILNLNRNDAGWLADFEACMAVALIQQ